MNKWTPGKNKCRRDQRSAERPEYDPAQFPDWSRYVREVVTVTFVSHDVAVAQQKEEDTRVRREGELYEVYENGDVLVARWEGGTRHVLGRQDWIDRLLMTDEPFRLSGHKLCPLEFRRAVRDFDYEYGTANRRGRGRIVLLLACGHKAAQQAQYRPRKSTLCLRCWGRCGFPIRFS